MENDHSQFENTLENFYSQINQQEQDNEKDFQEFTPKPFYKEKPTQDDLESSPLSTGSYNYQSENQSSDCYYLSSIDCCNNDEDSGTSQSSEPIPKEYNTTESYQMLLNQVHRENDLQPNHPSMDVESDSVALQVQEQKNFRQIMHSPNLQSQQPSSSMDVQLDSKANPKIIFQKMIKRLEKARKTRQQDRQTLQLLEQDRQTLQLLEQGIQKLQLLEQGRQIKDWEHKLDQCENKSYIKIINMQQKRKNNYAKKKKVKEAIKRQKAVMDSTRKIGNNNKNDYKSSKLRDLDSLISNFIWQTKLTKVFQTLMSKRKRKNKNDYLILLLENINFGFKVERYIHEKTDDQTDQTKKRVHYQSAFDFLEPIIQNSKISENDLANLNKINDALNKALEKDKKREALEQDKKQKIKKNKKHENQTRKAMLEVLADLTGSRT